MRSLIACLSLFLVTQMSPATAAELLMFEEPGCTWCARWNAEVGVVYARTEEGRRAPLRRLDIHDPLPDGVALSMRARYTPTFVLVEAGREIGRIEGYPGEDFFWGLLGVLLDRLAAPERATQKFERELAIALR